MDKNILFKGKYQQFVQKGHWEYVERINCLGIVIILPLLKDKAVILVEQYRIPVQNRVVEFPAGLAGDIPGETHEPLVKAAQRELWEETGYEAREMHHLTKGPPSPGMCSELIDFYLALGLKKTGQGGGDESEDILVHEISLNKIDEFLQKKQDAGLYIDPKVYSGLWFIQRFLLAGN